MLYDLRARLTAEYDPPAGSGRHVVRLMPASVAGVQRLVSGLVRFDPEPSEQGGYTDFWGNAAIHAVWRRDHDRMAVHLVARVDRLARGAALDLSAPVADLPGEIAAHRALGADAPHHFLGVSPRVPPSPGIAAWAREVAVTAGLVPGGGTAGRGLSAGTVFDLVRHMGQALHGLMRFDPGATTVETLPEQAFAARHGVCQDYAHILIAALRSVGVPAGYVSGFLRTLPPPGAARLEGADAMHAWVRAWTGARMGWVEYDPTNDLWVDEDHVLVAQGRDYGDAAPTRGVLRLSGTQGVHQMVDVVPVGGGPGQDA